MATIDFSDDIVNISDIIERIEELREEREEREACQVYDVEDCEALDDEDLDAAFTESDKESAEELVQLLEIMEELEGNGGDEKWEGNWYPQCLIEESYFETYMDEMIEDCYTLPKDIPAFMQITYDYEMLKQDYIEIEIDGNTFYYR